jgi:hypothetical protein
MIMNYRAVWFIYMINNLRLLLSLSLSCNDDIKTSECQWNLGMKERDDIYDDVLRMLLWWKELYMMKEKNFWKSKLMPNSRLSNYKRSIQISPTKEVKIQWLFFVQWSIYLSLVKVILWYDFVLDISSRAFSSNF